jgi:hypothetical protein
MLSIDGVFATTTPSAISWSEKPVRKNSGRPFAVVFSV